MKAKHKKTVATIAAVIAQGLASTVFAGNPLVAQVLTAVAGLLMGSVHVPQPRDA